MKPLYPTWTGYRIRPFFFFFYLFPLCRQDCKIFEDRRKTGKRKQVFLHPQLGQRNPKALLPGQITQGKLHSLDLRQGLSFQECGWEGRIPSCPAAGPDAASRSCALSGPRCLKPRASADFPCEVLPKGCQVVVWPGSLSAPSNPRFRRQCLRLPDEKITTNNIPRL